VKPIICALLLCLTALPLRAQETRTLTPAAAEAIAGRYNSPTTIRLTGETRVPRGAAVEGAVASVGGPLIVAGVVRGDVLVINGDLRLEPGASVTGRAVVVGGRFDGDPADVAGSVLVYPEALRFRREGDRIIALEAARPSWLSAGIATEFGRADFMLTVDGSYNRVEGLPVSVGPRLELGRSNPTVIDARLIYRTRSGLRIHPEEIGHDVRLEQYVAGHRSLRLGIGTHSAVDPIELNGLSDSENSLSTFILHRDYRDHYERDGWRLYLVYDGRTRPIDAGMEYRSESHSSASTHTPWSLLDNDEPWRPQPQVAEGDLQTVRGWARWDSRNDPLEPATGWLVQAEVEQGLEGKLRMMTGAASVPPDAGGPEYRSVGAEFTAFQLDVRRYLRFSPRTRLALRGLAAGSPDDGELPPQRQHVLGGEGSLPGYERFTFDCGARDRAVVDGLLPYYGCDRVLLLQAEGRYALLSEDFSPGRWLGLDFDLFTTPELVVFADAGRAWVETESLHGRDGGTSSLRLDAGIGFELGRLGLYLAIPLSEEGDGANFFVRINPRF
jgi:hypothetical protein